MGTHDFISLPFEPAVLQRSGVQEEHDAGVAGRYHMLWDTWKRKLCHSVLAPEPAQPHGIICLWLDATVEEAIDMAWSRRPSEAFAMHTLALELCMAAVRKSVPEVARGATLPRDGAGCAPVPVLGKVQWGILAAQGLLLQEFPQAAQVEPPVLCRQYAVTTWFPYRGGCGTCALRAACAVSG